MVERIGGGKGGKEGKIFLQFNNVNQLINRGFLKFYMIFIFFQVKVNIIMENMGRLL